MCMAGRMRRIRWAYVVPVLVLCGIWAALVPAVLAARKADI